ncbi:MAG: DinB family protein [Acidobacteriota bacterium]
MTRDEILRALRQTRSLLLETIDGIPEDAIVTQPVTESWTVKDLLGHMAMWQQVALSFITDYRASGTPQSLGLENDAAVDAYNRRGADLRRDWSLARVRAELDDAQRNLLSAVETLSDDDLHRALPAPWHSATTLEQLIAINSYEHDPEHIEQIKRRNQSTTGLG